MRKDKEKRFEEIESMTKEETISEIKKFFKGNKKFIEQSLVLVYSSHDFVKLNAITFITDSWNWEKFMSISIDTKSGFKNLYYRKGNKKYTPSDDRKGNTTHDIDEYGVTIYCKEKKETEEYTF